MPPPPGRVGFLDTPQTEIKLRAGPRPLCWVWSVSDIDRAVATCGYDLGRIITMRLR